MTRAVYLISSERVGCLSQKTRRSDSGRGVQSEADINDRLMQPITNGFGSDEWQRCLYSICRRQAQLRRKRLAYMLRVRLHCPWSSDTDAYGIFRTMATCSYRGCDQFLAVCKIARSPSLNVTPDLRFAYATTLTTKVSQQAESEAAIVLSSATAYFQRRSKRASNGLRMKSEYGSGVCICEPWRPRWGAGALGRIYV